MEQLFKSPKFDIEVLGRITVKLSIDEPRDELECGDVQKECDDLIKLLEGIKEYYGGCIALKKRDADSFEKFYLECVHNQQKNE
ncbi:hypothetical protein V7024_15995 [Bacillus sp. JJ864]|uniref:hypothetical protein n=1 Tax=Bacillus sp. JJ864 TaxID=3122975 RepID=UPI003000D05D